MKDFKDFFLNEVGFFYFRAVFLTGSAGGFLNPPRTERTLTQPLGRPLGREKSPRAVKKTSRARARGMK